MRWRDGGLALLLLCPGVASAGLFPDMSIGYGWSGTPISDGSTHDFRIGLPSGYATYTWGGGAANGILFQGRLGEGATQIGGHFLGSSGSKIETSGEYFPARGDYFAVIYGLPWWADANWHGRVFEWFKNGTTVMPSATPPESWGIIRFRVGPLESEPVISDLGQFRKFGVQEIADGATFVGNEVVFKATIADADSDGVMLEMEVKPTDAPFDGLGTLLSATSSVGLVSVAASELISVSKHYEPGGNTEEFHWRARAVDEEGNASEWVEHGDDALADFAVKVVPLWTQNRSEFPVRSLVDDWATTPYASGIDDDCSSSDPSNATIAKCGCAITSAVMIGRYYGIENGIDGLPVSPLNINAWLNAHGGYIGENYVNWSKVEEYLGITIGETPHKQLALDSANFKTTSGMVVDSYLEDETPVIAFNSAAGHYFVMDGKITDDTDGVYTVRDPRWYRTQTLDDTQNIANEVRDYDDVYTHATIFTKLSEPRRIAAHVELFLASPAEVLVTDPQGRKSGYDPRSQNVFQDIPDSAYALEDPIATSDADLDPTAAHRVKALYLPEIVDGTYSIEIIGTGVGPYTLTAVMTDETGSTTQRVFEDLTSPGDVSTYRLIVEDEAPTATTLTMDEILSRLRALFDAQVKGIRTSLDVKLDSFERKQAEAKAQPASASLDALRAQVLDLETQGSVSGEFAEEVLDLLVQLEEFI